MARPEASDFLHSMRFHVTAGTQITGLGDAAGFSMVSTPEATVETVEYKEGTFVYTRKYPGNPTVSDITMSRGVTRGGSQFWHWLRTAIEGSGEYRTDLEIKHYHRDKVLSRARNDLANVTFDKFTKDAEPARTYLVHEAFPVRHKVAGDLDATASEISIMEIDVAYENFEIREHAA